MEQTQHGEHKAAWGGRFAAATDRLVESFTASIAVDHRLWRQDLTASAAHARMLGEVGILTPAEVEALCLEMAALGERFAAGEVPFRQELEDVHMHIESALIAKLGDTGRKLHTARSRNDQVATSLRLWTREAIDTLVEKIAALQAAFVDAAGREAGVLMPAYTHLQRAQPVLAAHYFLAHVERLERDRERLLDARCRVNVLPLGAAALAGTSLPIDRASVARQLGFAAVARNSLDAVADRDFVAEVLFGLSLVASHLSGWAEEWILWNTYEFGFLRLPDALCTGSSIMPQKKNPDVLELIRGRTGRVTGALHSVLMLLKGLPLAYNRDLQEDKQPLFDAVDTVGSCLDAACLLVRGATLDKTRLESSLDAGYLDATALMEELIRRGVPMRTAHGVVGSLVRAAEAQGVPLAGLPDAVIAAAHPALAAKPVSVLGAANAVAACVSDGSTGPAAVERALERWQTIRKNRTGSAFFPRAQRSVTMSKPKIVLAYSGGLDTTVILHWLQRQGYDVICFLADVGQRTEDLALIEARARRGGAADFVVAKLKDELLQDFFLPCLQAHCQYEGRYLLGTSIARPLIAKAQVAVARQTGAALVAHGATGKGNDQVRFELTYQALEPDLGILPVWRDAAFIAEFSEGRRSMIAYAEKHGLDVKATAAKPWSCDDNLLHISYEAGLLEDPWLGPPPALFERMVHPTAAPDAVERFVLRWQGGVPVAVHAAVETADGRYETGEALAEGLAAVFDHVDAAAARNGVGALGLVESRYVGMKSRGEYHAPGHTVLLAAHRDLEALCLTGSVILEKERRMPDLAALVYNGHWFDPLCVAQRAFIAATQAPVGGETRVALYKGNVMVEGRRSPYALYDADVASMDGEGASYRQEDASGFIRLHGLPLRLQRRAHAGLKAL